MKLSEVIEGCKKKERLAQQALFDLYKSRLMGVCRRYARTRDGAQDILLEAFFKILTKIDQVEEVEKFEGWMMKITVHTAINHYRASLKFKDHVDIHGRDLIQTNEDILSSLSNEIILELIEKLPDGARVVFNLHVIEGYTHVEISEMLGLSEGTSRSQFHYAKNLLKARLNKINQMQYAKREMVDRPSWSF